VRNPLCTSKLCPGFLIEGASSQATPKAGANHIYITCTYSAAQSVGGRSRGWPGTLYVYLYSYSALLTMAMAVLLLLPLLLLVAGSWAVVVIPPHTPDVWGGAAYGAALGHSSHLFAFSGADGPVRSHPQSSADPRNSMTASRLRVDRLLPPLTSASPPPTDTRGLGLHGAAQA
jgi:hypothetical protein